MEPGPERLLVPWALVSVIVSFALSARSCNTARHHISACKECVALDCTLATGSTCSTF